MEEPRTYVGIGNIAKRCGLSTWVLRKSRARVTRGEPDEWAWLFDAAIRETPSGKLVMDESDYRSALAAATREIVR